MYVVVKHADDGTDLMSVIGTAQTLEEANGIRDLFLVSCPDVQVFIFQAV